MNTNFTDLEIQLRKEADLLLHNGLDDVLKQYGIPHYTGSYALHLMTWRDLDIYLEAEELSISLFFELGNKIATLLNPVKMHFRNETIARTEGLPFGLYWGIYLGDERKGAWKIDLWMMKSDECKERLAYCDNLLNRISPAEKLIILNIKSQCWQNPQYRKTFYSSDIYDAVLQHGVKDIDGFYTYLQKK